MKFKVQNIEEFSDSREMMELKPKKITFIFLYIILLSVISLGIWMWFSEKEIVVKLNGTIVSKSVPTTISNQIDGVIEQVKINDGQEVKEGDLLYVIDNEEYENENHILKNKKEYIIEEIALLDKLKESINDNQNYFRDKDNEIEYYYRYEIYRNTYEKNDFNTYKLQELLNVEQEKKRYNEELKNIEIDIQNLQEKINKCKVYATTDGLINIKTKLNKGRMLNNSMDTIDIYPNDSDYKVNLIIPENQISELKIGQDVKYTFNLSDKSSCNSVEGNLKNISLTPIKDSGNLVCYECEGSIAKEDFNYDKIKVYLKEGMNCEARVLIKKEKMLFYVLQQLGLYSNL